MRPAKALLALILALLWVPLSAHCQLEAATGLAVLQCESGGGASADPVSHCENFCCSWEGGHYFAPQTSVLSGRQLVLAALLPTPPISLAPRLPSDRLIGWVTAAPPDFLKPWQFSFRAALPARAPSVLS